MGPEAANGSFGPDIGDVTALCGRFSLSLDADAVAAHFGVGVPVEVSGRYNITPDQHIGVIAANAVERKGGLARWGFSPPWPQDGPKVRNLINARRETVAAKPTFREAVRRRRCLIPADGYYEWDEDKTPWRIHGPGGGIFAFAGIWQKRVAGDQIAVACAILTQAASGLLARIHPRMPVVLGREDYDIWLRGSLEQALVVNGVEGDEMEHYAVTRHVNRPGHDDAACFTPAADRIESPEILTLFGD